MDDEIISILTSEKYGKFNITHNNYLVSGKGANYLLENKVSQISKFTNK